MECVQKYAQIAEQNYQRFRLIQLPFSLAHVIYSSSPLTYIPDRHLVTHTSVFPANFLFGLCATWPESRYPDVASDNSWKEAARSPLLSISQITKFAGCWDDIEYLIENL